MGYFYLSNPYNGTIKEQQYRAAAAAETCFHLISKHIAVFSPIVHNHAMFSYIAEMTPQMRHDFIMSFDLTMLAQADGMLILKLSGWEQSIGVATEIDFCKTHDIPYSYHTRESILDISKSTFMLME